MNYLLVGSESFNLIQRKNDLISQTVGKADDMSVSVYKGIDKDNIDDIIYDCQMLPFFSDQKVVVYDNPIFLQQIKESSDHPQDKQQDVLTKLISYLNNPNETTTLIITYEGSLPENNKTVKQLASLMKYEKFDYLTADQFRNVVNMDLNDHGIVLDRRSQEELFNRLEINLATWKKELEKLVLYPGKITVQVVKDLISRPLQEDVFQLSNAVVDRNAARAVTIFRDLMVNHKNDIPSMIGLLANQFRTMSQVRIMFDQNLSLSQIAAGIGSKSEYRAKMVLKAINNLPVSKLMAILDDLSQLDQDIKDGKIDGQTGLELFIIRACRR